MSCANIGTLLVLTKQKAGSGYERLIIFTIAKESYLHCSYVVSQSVSHSLKISKRKIMS